jgi:hypothetical protein
LHNTLWFTPAAAGQQVGWKRQSGRPGMAPNCDTLAGPVEYCNRLAIQTRLALFAHVSEDFMSRLLAIFLALLVLLVVGGGIFLATWDIPAPKSKVEKVIPNDRLGK